MQMTKQAQQPQAADRKLTKAILDMAARLGYARMLSPERKTEARHTIAQETGATLREVQRALKEGVERSEYGALATLLACRFTELGYEHANEARKLEIRAKVREETGVTSSYMHWFVERIENAGSPKKAGKPAKYDHCPHCGQTMRPDRIKRSISEASP